MSLYHGRLKKNREFELLITTTIDIIKIKIIS